MDKAERREISIGANEFADWMRVVQHFFPDLSAWLNQMKDPRERNITYSEATLVFMCVMKNVGGIVTMRAMNETFATNEALINLSHLSGESVDEMPDWQTANNFLEHLTPDQLDHVRIEMINRLIRSKQFDNSRLLKCWRIILDGTGIAYFKECHCEQDLVRRTVDPETGKETLQYYHKVLEAKIVLSPDLILSIGTEFIENESADVSKQDCETRAAERLLKQIRVNFPRLSIVVQGDGLYATIPMMGLCKGLRMHYLFTMKDGCQPTLMGDFRDMVGADDFKDKYAVSYREETGIGRFVCHVEEYSGKPQVCNMFEFIRTDENSKEVCTTWITDLPITRKNLAGLISAGRGRWFIENKGFNNQKTGIYKIEHLCSKNPTAMKNHYLITQIADILMQLYLAFDKKVFALKKSIKGMARSIANSFTGRAITEEKYAEIMRRTTMRLNVPI